VPGVGVVRRFRYAKTVCLRAVTLRSHESQGPLYGYLRLHQLGVESFLFVPDDMSPSFTLPKEDRADFILKYRWAGEQGAVVDLWISPTFSRWWESRDEASKRLILQQIQLFYLL
jgi:hypothetical protein